MKQYIYEDGELVEYDLGEHPHDSYYFEDGRLHSAIEVARQKTQRNTAEYSQSLITVAYQTLKQPLAQKPKDAHHVGVLTIASAPAALDACISYWQRQNIAEFYDYPEYLHAVSRVESWQGKTEQYETAYEHWEHNKEVAYERWEYQKDSAYERWRHSDNDAPEPMTPPEPSPPPPPRYPLNRLQQQFTAIYKRRLHTSDRSGYLNYLEAIMPDLFNAITSPLPAFMNEAQRAMHTYIIGGSGSGKSELLKVIIYSYAKENSAAVVVLDPNGDFAEQVARWKEFTNNPRLVYWKYNLLPQTTPVINPFQISGLSPDDRSHDAINTRMVLADQLLDALKQIISKGEGGGMTTNMEALLIPCILTLLEREGSTLQDLKRFMIDDDNDDLISHGMSLSHYPDVKYFFQYQFSEGSFRQTKDAIAKKLQYLLNFRFFSDMTCGESTIDLEKLVNQKKIIVFNLSKGRVGNTIASAIGRLIVAMLQGIAKRREDIPEAKRIPCHLILDECHNFISPSIEELLSESRKYKLHATLCQQVIGLEMSTTLKNIVLMNTAVKVGGSVPPSESKDVAEMVGADRAEYDKLTIGQFYVAAKGAPTLKIQANTELLKDNNCVYPLTFKLTARQQVKDYYRSIEPIPAADISNNPDVQHDEGITDTEMVISPDDDID